MMMKEKKSEFFVPVSFPLCFFFFFSSGKKKKTTKPKLSHL